MYIYEKYNNNITLTIMKLKIKTYNDCFLEPTQPFKCKLTLCYFLKNGSMN